MADTINHFALGYTIGHLAGSPPVVSVALGVWSAWPDLALIPGHIKAMIKAKSFKARDWTKYQYWHTLKWFFLHNFIDKYCHDPLTGKWTRWGYWIDFVLWIIVAACYRLTGM